MTEFMGLAEKVSKFNQQALKHIENQTLNPFSGRFSRSPSPRPKFNKDEYGKPAAGSLTEIRGQRAFSQISREIMELCEVIHDMGARRRDSDGDECIIIPFGELFAFYTKISDKVVGLLIAAKKRGFVYFEPEILFQRRDDDVLIALLKPIAEIRNIINRQVSASPSPAPLVPSESDKTSRCTTPSPLAQQETTKPEVSTSSPITTASAEKEQPATSSPAENASQQTLVTVNPVETDNISSPDVTLPPVEEELVSTLEAPIVEEPAPSSETLVESEKTLPVTTTDLVEDKENSPSTETPLFPQEAATSPSTVPSDTEPISQSTEQTVPTEEEKTHIETTTASTEQVPLEASGDQTSPKPEEKVLSIKSSQEQDSALTLTIIVESDQSAAASTPAPDVVPSISEIEENTRSSEGQAPAVESSSIVQSAPENEQTCSAPAVTAETTQTLPPSDKSEEIASTNEKEQAPPSNDTGEKTLA